MFTPVTHADGD